MEKYEIQKLRELPIEGVAQRLGLRVERHKSLCPFHDDSHPSLSYRVSKNTYRCFVCGASGGTIDLVMRHLHVDFKEACRWLADEHNVIIDHSPFLRPDGSKRPSAERTIDHYAAQREAAANNGQCSMFNGMSGFSSGRGFRLRLGSSSSRSAGLTLAWFAGAGSPRGPTDRASPGCRYHTSIKKAS